MSGDIALRTTRFVPASLAERMEFAKALAVADMLPKAFRDKPANVLLVMEYGDSLAIPYAQAISTINVIEGKPSASAGLISALVRRAGHRLRVTGDDTHAVATIIRSDDPDFEYRSEWTVDRAVRAGLCTLKDGRPYARSQNGKVLPWEAYTAALLKARCTTEVARDACQEVLMGIMYTAEELGAVVDEDGLPVEDHRQARRPVQVQAEVVTAPVEPASTAAGRPCGHPGDPNTRCGTCIADRLSQRAAQTETVDAEPVSAEPEEADPEQYAAPPVPTEVDEADWVQQWHERFDAACATFQMTTMADLGREAGEHGRADLVAHAKARWTEVAQQYRTDNTGGGE